MKKSKFFNVKHNFNHTILREYDIRGTWLENLNENDAYSLAEKLTTILHKKISDTSNYCALVARDGRSSSSALSKALMVGFRENGLDAIDLGLLPTPALYFAERKYNKKISHYAVMVTGSHNPHNQNGFKIIAQGKPFFGKNIQKLANIKNSIKNNIKTQKKIYSPKSYNIKSAYIKRMLEEDKRIIGGQINAIWDAGGGASAEILPSLLPKLQGKHQLLFGKIDPYFKDRPPDPAMPNALKVLQNEIVKQKASIALAFDGDADRLLVMLPDKSSKEKNNSKLLKGDQLLLIFAEDLIQQIKTKNNKIQKPTILCDIKTSPDIIHRIKQIGGNPILVPTGHANIKHQIIKKNADIAGEVSGHIFFNDRYFGYDDAIYAAVRLCAMLRNNFSIEKSLAALPKRIATEELRIQVEEEKKFNIVNSIQKKLQEEKTKPKYKLSTIDGVRVEYKNAWWLLRASNTEAAIVLRAEAENSDSGKKILGLIADMLHNAGCKNAKLVKNAKLTSTN